MRNNEILIKNSIPCDYRYEKFDGACVINNICGYLKDEKREDVRINIDEEKILKF